MDDAEREALIRQVNRQRSTVGASIPETITINGAEIEFAEFIIESREIDELPPDAEEILEDAKRTFRTERASRRERLETAPLDNEAAEQLADEINGIDRALNALETIRHPDYGEQSKTATSSRCDAPASD
jgi:ribonuclease HII